MSVRASIMFELEVILKQLITDSFFFFFLSFASQYQNSSKSNVKELVALAIKVCIFTFKRVLHHHGLKYLNARKKPLLQDEDQDLPYGGQKLNCLSITFSLGKAASYCGGLVLFRK